MKPDPKLLSPCGLYCGVCAVYIATRDDNQKFKERLVGVYKGKVPGGDDLSVEDIHCEGCLSENPFGFCRSCPIKDCSRERGFSGCHQCAEFPCDMIQAFPLPVGKKVILRAVPFRAEHGDAQWAETEEARYLCPACGHALFRGAKRCNQCKTPVDLD
ncbi:MAG: DUF3795 domain-containing protein [Deltaproteobacteria bacterium]|nr:DUF3795 domain-containing protein [Deltaproteobacteria bacterium]